MKHELSLEVDLTPLVERVVTLENEAAWLRSKLEQLAERFDQMLEANELRDGS